MFCRTMNRVLNIVSGVSVLLATLAFAHLIHHFWSHSPQESYQSPVFWMGIVFAVIVEIFAFVGGCLLLRRGR